MFKSLLSYEFYIVFLVTLLCFKSTYVHKRISFRIKSAKHEEAKDFRKRYVLYQVLGSSVLFLIFGMRPELMVLLLIVNAVGEDMDFQEYFISSKKPNEVYIFLTSFTLYISVCYCAHLLYTVAPFIK